MDVPEAIEPFLRASVLLLPGEKENEFFQMMILMVLDIDPQTHIEWLCTIDLGTLFWEIQRYRRWKIAIIATNRTDAVEEALRRSDPNYLLVGPNPAIRVPARLDTDKSLRA